MFELKTRRKHELFKVIDKRPQVEIKKYILFVIYVEEYFLMLSDPVFFLCTNKDGK